MRHFIKTFILLMFLTCLLLVVGYYAGGLYGFAFMLLFVVIINLFSYWFSDKIILKMYKATEVDHGSRPEIYLMVDELSRKAEIPTPRIFVSPHKSPNAFATGRNPSHGVVCLTQGLIQNLDENELKGVIAHELSHIKHWDILIHMIAATMAGIVSSVAYILRFSLIFAGGRKRGLGTLIGSLALFILAPIVAVLIQLAISRSREYAADIGSARITGNPMYLANALAKISQHSQADLHKARNTAHFFIASPLKKNFLGNLFRTHPPIEERITKLKEMI